MLNLIIETTNENRRGDIENAYNLALETSNLNDFIKSLESNIGNSKVGRGGSHIWITEQNNERIGMILI